MNISNLDNTYIVGPMRQALYLLGLLAVLGTSFWLQIRYLMWGEWSFDQGFYLLIAKLLVTGYQPYTEIFLDRPPLFFWNIGAGYDFFRSVEGLQLLMVMYSILLLAAQISIGTSLFGRIAGLLAGGLLAFHFDYFLSSGKVMPEIPAMSLAFVSLACVLRYQKNRQRGWLLASSAAFGGSVLINYFVPWLVPLVLLVIVVPPIFDLAIIWQLRHRIFNNLVMWLGLFLLVAYGSWVIYGFRPVLEQAILFHLNKSAGTERSLVQNFVMLGQMLASQPLLSGSALLGGLVAVGRWRTNGWVALGWLGLTLLFLALYSPLRRKHLIVLLPVLALLAAAFISALFNRRRPYAFFSGGAVGWSRWLRPALGVGLALLLAAELAAPFASLSKPYREMVDSEMKPLLELLARFTTPNDCLITDHPYLAFVSDRLPPPWLANLSYARFDSGSIDTSQLQQITDQYHCPVVAPILDRIKNSDRTYYDWAKSIYMRTWVLDGREIMLGKPRLEAQPQLPLEANLSGQVKLLGADWQPGQHDGYLSLYWHTLQPFSEDFKIFVQLRNQEGHTVANADHEAFHGLLPTRLWYPGHTLKVTNQLTWPADLPPGRYGLYVGMYHPVTGERLPINQDASGENAIIFSDAVTIHE